MDVHLTNRLSKYFTLVRLESNSDYNYTKTVLTDYNNNFLLSRQMNIDLTSKQNSDLHHIDFVLQVINREIPMLVI